MKLSIYTNDLYLKQNVNKKFSKYDIICLLVSPIKLNYCKNNRNKHSPIEDSDGILSLLRK